MKVGDLVHVEFHDEEIGVIVKRNALGFYVWIGGETRAYCDWQLRLVKEDK